MKKLTLLLLSILSAIALTACGEPKNIEGTVAGVQKGKSGFIASLAGVPRGGYLTSVDTDGNGSFVLLHSNEKLFNEGDIINVEIEKKLFSGTYMHPKRQEKTKMVGYSFKKYTFIHNEPEKPMSKLKDKIINMSRMLSDS